MKLSPLNFHLSIFIIEINSPTRRVDDSPTRRVGESLREKRQHQNRLFAHEGRHPLRNLRKKTIFCPKMSVEFMESLSLLNLDP